MQAEWKILTCWKALEDIGIIEDLQEMEVNLEEPLELISSPVVAAELSDDPVRLYLREIGQIELLSAESEFRLATRNEANKRLNWLQNRMLQSDEEPESLRPIFSQILDDLLNSDKNLRLFCSNQVIDLPDFSLVLAEAQALRDTG